MSYYQNKKIEGDLGFSRLLSNAEPLITPPAAINCRHKKAELLWLSLLPVSFLLTLISSISFFLPTLRPATLCAESCRL